MVWCAPSGRATSSSTILARPTAPSVGAAPSLPGGLSGSFLNGVGGGYVAVEYVFIQFAGFTFGKSASAYATPWQGFPGNISSFLMGGEDSDTGVNNIQYTAQFGNGVSGSIGLDDPSVWDRTSLYNLSVGLNAVGTSSFAYGGTHSPDIIGNIRVDQAWGLFQFSAAAQRSMRPQHPGRGRRADQPVGNLRSPRAPSGVERCRRR